VPVAKVSFATSPTSLGAFLNSGTFGNDGPDDSSATFRSVAACPPPPMPTVPPTTNEQLAHGHSSRPKQSVGQRVEVSDVSGLVSLVAQRHAVMKDRDKLLALSDVASLLLTESPLLPRARDNIALSNRREVLMEELAEHRINVQNLQHLSNVANEEHERLLTVNDSLLAMVRRKDDLHAQTTQQFYIAGTMDAEANETLMKLEGRRRTLQGFASAMKRDVERILCEGGRGTGSTNGGARTTTSPHRKKERHETSSIKTHHHSSGPNHCVVDVLRHDKASATQFPTRDVSAPKVAGGHSEGPLRPTMRGDGWTTAVDDNGNRKKLPPSRLAAINVTGPHPQSSTAPSARDKAPQGGGSADDVERRLFELRLSGHELLRQLEAAITESLDCGGDVIGGVEGPMRTAQQLRAVLTEPTDGRGSLWLFSSCTKPTCLIAREKLRMLLPPSQTTKSPTSRLS
jgi:hypothetical protein